MLTLGQIPQHGNSVLTTAGAQGAIRGDGNSVDDAGVANEICGQSAGLQVPNLDNLIPSTADNHRQLGGRRETDAARPVSVTLFSGREGVLAFAESVPELDCAIARSRDNLSVIGGEGDGHDILGVILESSGCVTSAEIPQAQSLVPGSRESELAIRGQHNVGHKMRVTRYIEEFQSVTELT